jgi:hypothetical protein
VSKWRAVAVAVAVALFAATLTAIAPSPASAVTTIECNRYGGAPSVGGRAGVVTGYYSHRCNSLAGVTGMLERLIIRRDFDVVADSSRSYVQTGVDFSTTASVPPHGTFFAQMHLEIYGNFSYGSVPGCKRVMSNKVVCDWYSQSRYF